MKRRLSALSGPGKDHRILTESFDFDPSENRTSEFENWEPLFTQTMAPYLSTKDIYMINDNHNDTKADFGGIAMQKNPKNVKHVLSLILRVWLTSDSFQRYAYVEGKSHRSFCLFEDLYVVLIMWKRRLI